MEDINSLRRIRDQQIESLLSTLFLLEDKEGYIAGSRTSTLINKIQEAEKKEDKQCL